MHARDIYIYYDNAVEEKILYSINVYELRTFEYYIILYASVYIIQRVIYNLCCTAAHGWAVTIKLLEQVFAIEWKRREYLSERQRGRFSLVCAKCSLALKTRLGVS